LLEGVDPFSFASSDSFAFPFAALVGVLDLLLGDVGESGARGRAEGKKIAAHLSYSRQSKYDLANKYLENSSASNLVSSGSELLDGKIAGGGDGSTPCICESVSVPNDEELETVVGMEMASSAALDCVRCHTVVRAGK